MLNEASGSPESPEGEPNDVAGLREEIDEVEREAARRIEPGSRGFVIAVLAFVLIIAQLLPWVQDSAGWQVLVYGEDGALPRLFAATSAGFGVGASALALTTRRWWLSWVCAVGACVASLDGVLAVWSLQSSAAPDSPGVGPGFGLVLALLTVMVLAVNWLRVAFSRTT